MSNASIYDVVIIGGGPAGLTAGIYLARDKVKVLLLEKMLLGGQAAKTHIIENYPGFPKGVEGGELADLMAEQGERFGLKIDYAGVHKVVKDGQGFEIALEDGRSLRCKFIIIAAGAEPTQLGVTGEAKYVGAGVSYCATCDGVFFQDKVVAVVGGGDTAVEEAVYLTRYSQKVYLIHRRDQLRAAQGLQEELFSHPDIEVIWDTVVRDIEADKVVKGLILENVKTKEKKKIAVDGVFVAIGQKPSSEIFTGLVKQDQKGYILTDEKMETTCSSIYAVGDVRQKDFRQVITAASDGAIAAWYVQKRNSMHD